ncbi:MAG: acyl-CoA thioesterase, partial [Acidimicrobiales bacterium]
PRQWGAESAPYCLGKYGRSAMLAGEWLGLEPTHNPHRWMLPVTPGVATGGGFLFGGCGLGAAIAALEGTTGRPVVWATSQYLSHALVSSVVDIDVTIAVSGHRVTQARAVAHVADREILTVNAALGQRSFDTDGQWEQMPPDVPPPDDCPPRGYRRGSEESIMRRLDVRLARARDFSEFDRSPGDGSCSLWARVPDLLEPSAASLAILGDYVPFGVSQVLGDFVGGTSLDNTLRVARLTASEWVLCDVRVHAMRNGFAHGLVHLWAEDGTLLAIASQSCIVRRWRSEEVDTIRANLRGEREEATP